MSFRVEVLLSVQSALLGLVSPGLRGVATRMIHPRIELRFLFDGTADEEDREDVSEVEAYVVADFSADVSVETIVEADMELRPRDLRPGEVWVYLRKESV